MTMQTDGFYRKTEKPSRWYAKICINLSYAYECCTHTHEHIQDTFETKMRKATFTMIL